jgi:predicted alpha/beta hydrolase
MEKIIFTATDGYKLHGLWLQPVGAYKDVIILNSATGVKKEYYINFARYLVQNGYCVLLYDYRGIGASAPKSLKGFKAFMHQWGTLDMNAALDYVIEEKKFTSVIWMGHSVGAQMMGLLKNRKLIKKVIGINTSIGYWKYFHFPYNWMVFFLWNGPGPLSTLISGYAPMNKFGWGEPLPSGVYFEWRKWCHNKNHFSDLIVQYTGKGVFEDFNVPFTVIHSTDDYIANTKTVNKLLEFYPNTINKVITLNPRYFGIKHIGHTGIFRKSNVNTLWPIIIDAIEV